MKFGLGLMKHAERLRFIGIFLLLLPAIAGAQNQRQVQPSSLASADRNNYFKGLTYQRQSKFDSAILYYQRDRKQLLEQTDNSMDLGESTELPSKCVLLLGREKEGIPVELLQEIDCCVEIPQYGVIRSLNVHVSAALAIWEITKLNHAFLDGDNMSKLID